MNLPFFIARRYLVKTRGAFSSFIIRISIVATALSVAVMILAIAFITGFKYTVREKMYSFLGHIHIELFDQSHANSLSQEPIKYDPQLVSIIQHTKHVQQIFPFTQRPAIIQAQGQMEGIQLKGVNEAYALPKEISLSGNKVNYRDSGYAKEIIISENTAGKLNINAGDTVQIYFIEQGQFLPRIRKVRVSGLYHTGMEDVDKFYALCDTRLLQHINNWTPDDINGYQIDLDNDKYADTLSNYIYQQYIKPPLNTYTIRDIYPSVFDWLDLQDVNAKVILIIMAVVAIINLVTALMILIIEQVRMVGLLKALGMAINKMRRIFLYYSALIATIGIIAGNILALLICWLQQTTGFLKLNEETYYMKQVPVRIYWWQIAGIDAGTLFICIVCMWLPTLYIRRIQPARVLQFK